ncbi:MAG: hypothetical protein U1F87_09710 [Kiritimatiellia bacterium]
MHCMDSDYSVFSILPPYNTVNAQLVAVENNRARLVTDFTPYAVTYEPMADMAGSISTTSRGKSNFWRYSGGDLRGLAGTGHRSAGSRPGAVGDARHQSRRAR